jgi:signal peptidase I
MTVHGIEPVSDTDPSEKAPARPPKEADGAPDPVAPVEANPIARVAFVGVWFVFIPLCVAQMRVFLLAAFPDTPLVEMLRGQPIPVSIVLFTVAAIALYSQRFSLPGATAAGVGGRPGLPPELRRRFDAARLLREEARAIGRAHGKEIERTLREEDRAALDLALDELARAMDAPTFDEQRFTAAFDKADELVDVRLSRWRKSEAREYVESILVAVMVALAIRAEVIEAFKIPSGSMIPTLLVGDHIFVNKLAYGPLVPFTKRRVWNAMPPKRGDVIVFAFPENPEEDFIKRVIALPGDKLEVKDARVWLNDKPIPRCYVGRTSYADVPETGPILPGTNLSQEGDLYAEFLDGQPYLTFYTLSSVTRTNAGPWFPKPGEVYVLGDNRNNSRDSREWWGQKGGGVPFENIRGRALWIWLSYTGGEGSKSDRMFTNVMGRPRLPASMRALQPMLDKCLGPNPPLDTAGLPGVAP